jgi:hypothetical protein
MPTRGYHRHDVLAERRRLQQQYPALFADLSAFLFQADPMGLNYEINPDEYDAEVGTILPEILELDDVDRIVAVTREEFAHWFGGPAIESATYEDLAEGMLLILRRYRVGQSAGEGTERQ